MLQRSVFRVKNQSAAIQSLRYLYTADALGLTSYQESREKTKLQYSGPAMPEKFRARMKDFVSAQKQNLVFSDDLKNMVHLAENNPEDVELLHKMLTKFNQQSSGVRFGSFVFGPVVMRYYYFTNNPQAALAAVKDPALTGMFDQLMTFQILMDLLYVNKMYAEVLEALQLAQERNIQGNKYPKNCMILAMAALYKMNTTESFQKACDILEQANRDGHFPMRRALTFAAGLALNQNNPAVALDVLSGTKQNNYVTVRNLKALALAEVGRLEDCLALLRSGLEMDNPEDRKRSYYADVLNRIEALVQESQNKEIISDFQNVKKAFQDRGHIEPMTLDAALTAEIQTLQPRDRDTWGAGPRDRNRSMVGASFDRRRDDGPQGNQSYSRYPRRPGLRDME